MLILVDLVQTHVFYLILLPSNLYTCIDLPNTNAQYTLINYNKSTLRIDHFLKNHSVELWIIVTLLIIICFLIMFH